MPKIVSPIYRSSVHINIIPRTTMWWPFHNTHFPNMRLLSEPNVVLGTNGSVIKDTTLKFERQQYLLQQQKTMRKTCSDCKSSRFELGHCASWFDSARETNLQSLFFFSLSRPSLLQFFYISITFLKQSTLSSRLFTLSLFFSVLECDVSGEVEEDCGVCYVLRA